MLKMNSKEFTKLRKTLEAKVNESIRGFNTITHLSVRQEEDHRSRVSMYVDGVNEVLKTIAEQNDIKYKQIRWPVYDGKKGADYSQIKI